MYSNREYLAPSLRVVTSTVESGFFGTINVGIEDAEVNDQGEF